MTSHSDETFVSRSSREPSKRSRHVDGSRGTGLGSIVRTSPLTPARSAWPRDAGPSRSTMYAVGGAKLFASPPTGHGWPTRHYTRLKAFGPAHGHYERTLQPGERSERTYWHHGSPDENALWRRRRALQVAAQNSRGGVRDARSHWEELLFTFRRSRGAAGRYQGTTGAAWAAAGVPRRPTDGSDGFPGEGRGLRQNFTQLRSAAHSLSRKF